MALWNPGSNLLRFSAVTTPIDLVVHRCLSKSNLSSPPPLSPNQSSLKPRAATAINFLLRFVVQVVFANTVAYQFSLTSLIFHDLDFSLQIFYLR
ncbi:hypothetical protein L195_g060328, partial [Trifolium pratense]